MLVENKTGAVNWSSQTPGEPKSEPPPQPQPSSEDRKLELTSDSFVLAKLVLEDISVDYRKPGLAEPLQFKIDECTGDMLPGRPFILSIKGKLLDQPYVTSIEIGSLQELVEESRSRMEIKTEIAKTQFNFAGALDLAKALRSLNVKASVTGERLDSLNGLLELDLPPLKSYKAAAQLAVHRDRLDLSDLVLQVGKSKLTGKLTADRSGGKPAVAIELNSPLIQLNDFDVGDWSPEIGDSEKPAPQQDSKKEKVAQGSQDQKSSVDGEVQELLSPEVLKKFNVRMDVNAKKVMSGTDELGSGVLTVTQKD